MLKNYKSNNKKKFIATTLALTLAFPSAIPALSSFETMATETDSASVNTGSDYATIISELNEKIAKLREEFINAKDKMTNTKQLFKEQKCDLSDFTQAYNEYIDAYYAYEAAQKELESIKAKNTTATEEQKNIQDKIDNTTTTETQTEATTETETETQAEATTETETETQAETQIEFEIVQDGIYDLVKNLNDTYDVINLMQEVCILIANSGTQGSMWTTATNELNNIINTSYDLKFQIVQNYSNDPELIEQITDAKGVCYKTACELYLAYNMYNEAQEDLANMNLADDEEADQDESETAIISGKDFMQQMVELYAKNLETAQANYDEAIKTYRSILDVSVDEILAEYENENSDDDVSSSSNSSSSSTNNVNDILNYAKYDNSADY